MIIKQHLIAEHKLNKISLKLHIVMWKWFLKYKIWIIQVKKKVSVNLDRLGCEKFKISL